MTPEIKRLIVGWATQDELRRLAQKQGMRTLREEAINLVTLDTTTISEVIRSVYAMWARRARSPVSDGGRCFAGARWAWCVRPGR